jgi:photosystem II stability/assembly factor-like uncharacterized protein
LLLLVGLVAARTVGTQNQDGEWSVKAPLASRSLLLDVAARDGLLVTVGERGHILISRDGGQSWTQADVPSRALLTGVHMHDSQLGWAVGHDHVVLRTRDGGRTWERVHYAPDKERPLLDVWFADAQRGLAIGAYGELLVTRDGGTTWEARAVNGDDDFHLNNIVGARDGTLYMAAEAGNLYRSGDAGETWEKLPSPYEGSFFGMLPLSDGSLLAFGLRGRLFRSADQARTWQQIETGTEATLTSALEYAPGRFIVAGLAGTLLWGDTASGSVRTQELSDRQGIVAATIADEKTVLLFGEGGVERVEVVH